MCVAFVLKSPEKTLVALNRDEFYSRHSTSMRSHVNGLFCGVDLKSQGTWLAVNSHSEYSFVTNIRNKDLYSSMKTSRWELPLRALMKEEIDSKKYNPFNLIQSKHRIQKPKLTKTDHLQII
jgi:uncharacterized protein with NRDE domain